MKDILIAFAHVFVMMAPWLVFGFLMAGAIAVHWASAVFLAAMMVYNLVRPVRMGH